MFYIYELKVDYLKIHLAEILWSIRDARNVEYRIIAAYLLEMR